MLPGFLLVSNLKFLLNKIAKHVRICIRSRFNRDALVKSKYQNLSSKSEVIYEKLGPNERAIINKVKISYLRNLLILVVGLKMRLQFTGWLQFLIPVPFATVILILAAVFYLLGATEIAFYGVCFGATILIVVALDILTVRFDLQLPQPRPKRQDDLTSIELIQKRKSCRSYQRRKLTNTDREELLASVEEYMNESEFTRGSIRLEYISAPLIVWPTVNGNEFLVALAPAEYDRKAVMEVGYKLQKVVINATRMGLGTCWIGPGADHESVAAHLGEKYDSTKDSIVCVCAIGYPSWFVPLFIRVFSWQMRHRLPLDKLFFSDEQMSKSLQLNEGPFKSFRPIFEACRWSPSSYNGQTTRSVGVLDEQGNLNRFDFYAVTASRYYAAVAVGIWCANWQIGCSSLGIDGHFEILSDQQRGCHNTKAETQLPRYDVSWMIHT